MKEWALKIYFGTLGICTNYLGRIGQGVTDSEKENGEVLGVGGGAGAVSWIGFLGQASVQNPCNLTCLGTLKGSAGLTQGLHSTSNS